MDNNISATELSEYYSKINPADLSNDELAYAVIYSLTSMEHYNFSDDDDYDYDDDDYDDDYDSDDDDFYNDDFDEIDEETYEKLFLFWQKRCKEFQFELWQRGWEAIRVELYEGIYIPILQPRGYNIPLANLISDFCRQSSTATIKNLIDLLAAQNDAAALEAATPFVLEYQKRFN